ncbi:hypothetical protein [Bartonella raoultii]|uniref:hypothetical protein n=1 Tax=Bartonella raoultii TaxID=1457020 RepID=UPI001ABB0C21|nr:hypothetical protein [Bartonella raoultii]
MLDKLTLSVIGAVFCLVLIIFPLMKKKTLVEHLVFLLVVLCLVFLYVYGAVSYFPYYVLVLSLILEYRWLLSLVKAFKGTKAIIGSSAGCYVLLIFFLYGFMRMIGSLIFDFSAYSTPNIVFAVGLFPIGMAIMQFFLLSHWVAEDNGNGVEVALGVGMGIWGAAIGLVLLTSLPEAVKVLKGAFSLDRDALLFLLETVIYYAFIIGLNLLSTFLMLVICFDKKWRFFVLILLLQCLAAWARFSWQAAKPELLAIGHYTIATILMFALMRQIYDFVQDRLPMKKNSSYAVVNEGA